MAANDTKKEGVSVPYTSFKTLLNTADRMKEEGGAPSRVDRSYLSNMPGGERGIFTLALKILGLVNDELEPTDDFHELIDADEAERRAVVRRLVERVYVAALDLPKRATQNQLETAFREYGASGSTLRRAIAFFLAATDFAGIERSPNFRLPKRDRSAKPRNAGAVVPAPEIPPPLPHRKPEHAPPAATHHPLIEGLIRELPDPGQPFPEAKQEAWFAIAKHTFRLIYPNPNGSDSAEARRQAPSIAEASSD